MFGLLKKKITSFIDQLTKKEEQKPEEPDPASSEIQPPEPRPSEESKQPTTTPTVTSPRPTASTPTTLPTPTVPEPSNPEKSSHPAQAPQPAATPSPPSQKATPEKTAASTTPIRSTEPAASKPVEPAAIQKPASETPDQKPTPAEPQRRIQPPAPVPPVFPKPKEPVASIPIPKPTPVITTPSKTTDEPPKERKLSAKLGILSQIKSLITRDVQIQPAELEPMLDELNMALLESDVTLDTADHIVATIKTQLSGKKVDKSRVQAEIQAAVKTALVDVLDKPPLDLIDYIRQHEKPVKILFLGPNGAGKTTTLAKIAYYLKQNDLRVVLAAADTFRAAAIEQLQHHGSALSVPVIKHQYGADPAAVAFDAIAHAKAHGLDVVLIDTAGRQETNYNLLKEMEKINRVVQPDLKLFIGEAVAGHALVEQAKAFHTSLKLDGVVLTKVDCDAKGGTSFSVSHEVGVPIVLLGTGQGYGDIRTFDAAWLVSNVLAE